MGEDVWIDGGITQWLSDNFPQIGQAAGGAGIKGLHGNRQQARVIGWVEGERGIGRRRDGNTTRQDRQGDDRRPTGQRNGLCARCDVGNGVWASRCCRKAIGKIPRIGGNVRRMKRIKPIGIGVCIAVIGDVHLAVSLLRLDTPVSLRRRLNRSSRIDCDYTFARFRSRFFSGRLGVDCTILIIPIWWWRFGRRCLCRWVVGEGCLWLTVIQQPLCPPDCSRDENG